MLAEQKGDILEARIDPPSHTDTSLWDSHTVLEERTEENDSEFLKVREVFHPNHANVGDYVHSMTADMKNVQIWETCEDKVFWILLN